HSRFFVSIFHQSDIALVATWYSIFELLSYSIYDHIFITNPANFVSFKLYICLIYFAHL
ncbi:hypothetical protein GLOIN_2v1612940, partial [Rhizophagus irregularis DAOM 181602=DAOM 197198]